MTDGWQQQVAALARQHDLLHDPATHALDLVSEVGEVAKEILKATNYGQRPLQGNANLLDEMGDALYSLLALAECCGVDGDAALSSALDKYRQRLNERETAGSQ
jgi:NTP pyrophosphatase (non-canonical NTP hydrolase)